MIKGILLFIFVGLSLPGISQLSFSSVDEMIRYADRQSVAARLGRINEQAVRQDVMIARSGLLPKLNLFSTGEYYPVIATQLIPESVFGGADDKFRKVQFGLPLAFTAGAEISVPVINFEKWAQLERSRFSALQSNWQQKAALENLHIQLIQLYYQELAMKSALALNKKNQETTSKLMAVMTERLQQGILNPSDFHRTRNLEFDMRLAGIDYERTLRQVRTQISHALNITDSTSILITDSLPAFTWPAVEKDIQDINSRPGWKEADVRVSVAEKSLQESHRAALPKLGFYGRYLYNWQMKPSSNVNVSFDVSTLGLRLDIPVFQGNYYRSLQKKNAFALEAARLEKEKVQSDLIRQQKEWYNNYMKAWEQHRVLVEKMKSANENLRIAELNMQEGIMEFEAFNEIFLEYNKANLDHIRNLLDGILYYHLIHQN